MHLLILRDIEIRIISWELLQTSPCIDKPKIKLKYSRLALRNINHIRPIHLSVCYSLIIYNWFFHWRWGGSSTQAWMPTYVSIFSRWCEFGERRWNDILTGETRRTRRKTCLSATLSTTNTTWIDPGLRGERPATNDLSHGMAYNWFNIW
jgi:hypothetical protein